jgi:outer membrane protein TolC
MTRSFVPVLLLTAVCITGVAPAAELPTAQEIAVELGYDLSQPLTLDQCVALALRVHPDMRVAAAELDQARASLRQARASQWPVFRLSSDYRVTEQPERSVVIGGSVIQTGGGRTTSRNTQIDGSYTLYDPSRSKTIRQAEVYRQAAQAGVEDAERQLVYMVTQAYFDQLAAERLATVEEASVASSQAHVDEVQARIDAGDAAPVDIHTVRAQLHAAQLQLASARTQTAIAQASLRLALGSPTTDLQLADAWEQPTSLPDLADVLSAAFADRPDLRRQEAVVRAARLGARLAHIAERPQVSVSGGGEYGRHDGQSGPSWSIFGGVTQTLFDGGAAKAAVARARADVDAAEAQLERLRQNASLEVESAWWRLRQSAEAIASAEAGQTEARAALAAAETRYAANVGILLEVTDAQVRASDADVSVVRAYYDYNVALADLRRATAAGRE